MEEQNVVTYSAQQTEKLGFEFAKQLKSGDVICMYGELGAGKTTFTQGIARGLGINSRVISPTFSLVRQYRINRDRRTTGSTLETMYHIDLYRLTDMEEIKSIGIQEILDNHEGIVLIEWPEKIESLLPPGHISVKITEIEEGRNIHINQR